jgi:hypothetical protein
MTKINIHRVGLWPFRIQWDWWFIVIDERHIQISTGWPIDRFWIWRW